MDYKNNNTSKQDWVQINKREFFCKAVNSIMMNENKEDIVDVLKTAKTIVDTAFKNYPDNTDGKGEQIEDIIN